MTTTLKIAQCNVPSSVGRDNWERCWRRTAAQAPIFGLQEAFLSKDVYRTLTHLSHHGVCGLAGSPNPIFWDHKIIKRKFSHVVRLHARGESLLARRFPGYNDARYATDGIFEHIETGMEFAVINTHWVVGPGKYLPTLWQKWARREAIKKVRRLVKAHLKAGRPVFVIGDTNIRVAMEPLVKNYPHGSFRWIKNEDIDKSGIGIPDDMRLTDWGWENFDAPTDHKDGGVVTTVTIAPRRVMS